MKTKNVSKFVILSLIILFGMSISIEIATAQQNPITSTADSVDDPQGDVIIWNLATGTCEDTSLHDELDIDTMVRSGQTFTITLYKDFTEIPLSGGYLNFFEIEDGLDTYTAAYVDVLGIVTFANDDSDTWDGSVWNGGTAASIGSVSGKTLTIEIPTGALTITSSMDWLFRTYFKNATLIYMDITPDDELADYCSDYTPPDDTTPDDTTPDDTTPDDTTPDDGDGSSIPGYEFMPLLLITSFTVSGIIYIYMKKNKFK